jgi:hypothetical protein
LGRALKAHPARAGAPAAADGVEDLLAVVVERAQEHPPRKAVEALALLVLDIFVVVLGSTRMSEIVASERVAVYTEVVHSLYPFCGPCSEEMAVSVGAFLLIPLL